MSRKSISHSVSLNCFFYHGIKVCDMILVCLAKPFHEIESTYNQKKLCIPAQISHTFKILIWNGWLTVWRKQNINFLASSIIDCNLGFQRHDVFLFYVAWHAIFYYYSISPWAHLWIWTCVAPYQLVVWFSSHIFWISQSSFRSVHKIYVVLSANIIACPYSLVSVSSLDLNFCWNMELHISSTEHWAQFFF